MTVVNEAMSIPISSRLAYNMSTWRYSFKTENWTVNCICFSPPEVQRYSFRIYRGINDHSDLDLARSDMRWFIGGMVYSIRWRSLHGSCPIE